ncbi:platelet-activating factor acetylhydrolase isoform 1 [Stylonychia lemnae]|uniref:1-alkyl-2-acetylglycerophosphocholine esterase n=1 Tax=Stylonychia lemnae TaxID=5949 RepID=A0A078AXG6_STYLE|nr:platelet-activating factor acetylhydrolase isoform 1 [Stylonychia lemnae]|eukprot:CDW86859.1 platelet-activating factor acetylhydrolase isoform 1 [Stylonychia lemnae]
MASIGDPNYSKYPTRGPYNIGFKQIRTDKFDNEVIVFYPVDKDPKIEKDFKHKTFSFFDTKNQNEFIKGILHSMQPCREPYIPNNAPEFFYRFLLGAKIKNSFEEAPLSKDFTNKELIPILYSHGLSAHPRYYSQMLNDYASHGFIIFAIAHRDRSCSVTQDKLGNFTYLDGNHQKHEYEFRAQQLRTRENEFVELINEVANIGHIQNKLNLGKFNLGIQNLVVSGHSFGGITCISAAQMTDKAKNIVAFDPWTYVYQDKIVSGKFIVQQPMYTVMTEHFERMLGGGYIWEGTKSLQEFAKSEKNESIILKHGYHYDQQDLNLLTPFEALIFDKRMPSYEIPIIYQLNSQLGLLYLSKLGLANSYKETDIRSRVDKYMSKYVNYHIEYKNKRE